MIPDLKNASADKAPSTRAPCLLSPFARALLLSSFALPAPWPAQALCLCTLILTGRALDPIISIRLQFPPFCPFQPFLGSPTVSVSLSLTVSLSLLINAELSAAFGTVGLLPQSTPCPLACACLCLLPLEATTRNPLLSFLLFHFPSTWSLGPV